MNAFSALVKRHPLTSFFVISYVFAWLGWTMPDLIYTGSLLTTIPTLFFIALVPGPLFAALIVTAVTGGKAGVMALLRKFTIWRVGWWWAWAISMLPKCFLWPVSARRPVPRGSDLYGHKNCTQPFGQYWRGPFPWGAARCAIFPAQKEWRAISRTRPASMDEMERHAMCVARP